MAISYNKKELEKKREKKRKEKQQRRAERKSAETQSFDDMIAYVDEHGVISSTPPDPNANAEIDLESIEVSTPKKEALEDTVLSGRVEHFNAEKGYGFIKDLSGIEKYFFHISHAPAAIAEGNLVSFELERGDRGMNAVRITLTNKSQ
ncbi:MAG TPA: DNA-binding protein [Treponema sp.]|jgi:cold shock CspA family protein|nr:DNA-binding protein [Treponema sp.]